MRRIVVSTLALLSFVLVAACDTAEERAEEHYQSALELTQEGDYSRAIVELRNAFRLQDDHLEARQLFADISYDKQENLQVAFQQYSWLAERDPEDLLSRVRLSRIAFSQGNWEAMDRHTTAAIALAPDDPEVQILSVVLTYQNAVVDDDSGQRRASAATATQLLADAPDEIILREVVLDNTLREVELSSALTQLNGLIADFPDEMRYWSQRLQVVIQLGDNDEIEAQLIAMADAFPDQTEFKANLVRFYLSRNELDDAELYLRALVADAEAAGEGDQTPRVDLIRFLTELRGVEAAMVEVEAAIAENPNELPFVIIASAIEFETGEAEPAIARLEAALDAADPEADPDQYNSATVALAQLLEASGNVVGARSRVEQVLAADDSNAGALKMSARWLTEQDDTDNAITSLRVALDQDAEDVEALNLMAEAYIRAGSPNLARDFLSLAVEASGNAPAETLRYAGLLIEEGRFLPAEDILIPALRLDGDNIGLLRMTGELYLAMEDFGRTGQVVETLRRLDNPDAQRIAVDLETRRINQQQGFDDALSYLETLANSEDADLNARVSFLRAKLASGDTEGALELAQTLVDENPDNPMLRLVLVSTSTFAGNLDDSIELLESLIADFPQEALLRLELSSIYQRSGRSDDARAEVEQALIDFPDNPALQWAQASYLEQDGDIDGAIEIYDAMYEQDSSSVVVANNLASLIATYRDDQESLDRAWAIARRFRDIELPAIQDTYGWITHRRGDSEEALPYLQGAAAGLSEDPVVQFHLAEALAALGQTQEALEQYRVVLQVAGVTDTRPQIDMARERIAALEAELQEAAPASE